MIPEKKNTLYVIIFIVKLFMNIIYSYFYNSEILTKYLEFLRKLTANNIGISDKNEKFLSEMPMLLGVS